MLYVGVQRDLPEPLDKENEKRLLAIKDVDRTARDLLIIHNQRLITHTIKKYWHPLLDAEDMFSIGLVGLIKAVDTYDTSKDVQLSTWASLQISQQILTHMRNKRKTQFVLSQVSLSEPIPDTERLTYLDMVSESKSYSIEDITILKHAVRKLPSRERFILLATDTLGLTQQELSEIFELSQPQISRIKTKALHRLKEATQ